MKANHNHAGLLLAYIAACSPAHSEPILVTTGKMTTVRHSQSGAVSEREMQFRAAIDHGTGNWIIEDLSNPPRSAQQTDKDVIQRLNTPEQHLPTLFVSSSTSIYPIDVDEDFRRLWLTFFGRNFLQKANGHKLVLPAGDPRLDLHTQSCLLEVTWRDPGDICPVSMVWRVSPELLELAPANLTVEFPGDYLDQRQRTFELLTSTMTNGQVLVRFEVQDWLQVQGTSIPHHWKYTSYSGLTRRLARTSRAHYLATERAGQ